jgi:hypothetical protein
MPPGGVKGIPQPHSGGTTVVVEELVDVDVNVLSDVTETPDPTSPNNPNL